MIRHLSRRTATALVVPALMLSACATTDAGVSDELGLTASEDAAGDMSDDMAGSSSEAMSDDTTDAAGTPAVDEDPEASAKAARVRESVVTLADGSTISLSELAGQQVFVETFATWCSNCRRQLADTQLAAAEAGDAAVFLALSIETTLDPSDLAAYADDNGFDDIQFAVLTADGLAAFERQFGSRVLNAPSTPKFRVAADGSLSEMITGYESPDEILAQLDA